MNCAILGKQPGLSPSLYSLENLQCVMWAVHKLRQLLHMGFLQVVQGQVQLSQMGVGLKSFEQIITAGL